MLTDFLLALGVVVSMPGTLILMYVVIFSGPGVLDGLPDPTDGKSEDS